MGIRMEIFMRIFIGNYHWNMEVTYKGIFHWNYTGSFDVHFVWNFDENFNGWESG